MTFQAPLTDTYEARQVATISHVMQDRTPVLMTIAGSALYGTATPESDDDIRGVFLPSKEQILLGSSSYGVDNNSDATQMGAGDIDVSAVSYSRYLALLGKLDMISVELLFAGQSSDFRVGPVHPLYQRIWERREDIFAGSSRSAIGHARQRIGAFFPEDDASFAPYVALRDIVKDLMDQGVARLIEAPEHLDRIAAVEGVDVVFFNNNVKPPLRETWDDMTADERAGNEKTRGLLFIEIGGKRIGISNPLSESISAIERPLSRNEEKKRARARGEAVGFKDAYQGVRIIHQAIELHKTRELIFPRPEAAYLRKVRNAELTQEDVKEYIRDLLAELADVEAANPFRDFLDQEVFRELVCEAHEMVVLGKA
jgi:hypothetical protein